MSQKRNDDPAGSSGAAEDRTRDNQEHELEAEEESAAAMDSDVPQPPDASKTTEGQPT
ncbi:MAG: hypothetical protein M3430_21625 [Acidobacteriota bacterium]|nr:hypothetical protein [Acidobacteriota bacterium]